MRQGRSTWALLIRGRRTAILRLSAGGLSALIVRVCTDRTGTLGGRVTNGLVGLLLPGREAHPAGRPGDGVDGERPRREDLPTALPQPGTRLVVEPGDVVPRGPNAQQVGLPPRVEVRVGATDVELGLLDLTQPGSGQQGDEVTGTGTGQGLLGLGVRIEVADRLPEGRERRAGTAEEIGRSHV